MDKVFKNGIWIKKFGGGNFYSYSGVHFTNNTCNTFILTNRQTDVVTTHAERCQEQKIFSVFNLVLARNGP